MEKLNKLQIRAKILPVIAQLRLTGDLSVEKFTELTEDLKKIDDKPAVFEILTKELEKTEDEGLSAIIRGLMIDLLGFERLEEFINRILYDEKAPDRLKYKLVCTLKAIGKAPAYEDFYNCFEDAESVISYDTQKLLEYATVNPETQIDFLDFLTALKGEDRMLLIDSLANDYSGDNLANILVPILYTDFPEDILLKTCESLGETNSAVAISGFEYLSALTDDETLKNVCSRKLKQIKFAGKTKKDAENFYKKALYDTAPYLCFASVPDGHYNTGLIFSRKRSDGSLMMFCAVVNAAYGVVDAFGFFTLSETEFERIVERFCKNEGYFAIAPENVKYYTDTALKKSKELKMPVKYEFVCWNMILSDVRTPNFDPDEILKATIVPKKIDKAAEKDLFDLGCFDKWFFTTKDNEEFAALIDKMNSSNAINIDGLENLCKEFFDVIWKNETCELFEKNLKNTALLFKLTGLQKKSEEVYSILFDEEFQQKMKEEIIKRSIYDYFVTLRQINREFRMPTNIFGKRTKKDKEPDARTVDKIIAEIENRWIEE